MKKTFLLVMLLSLMALPCSILALEKSTRDFPEQLTYFPMKIGGMLFVRNQDGSFYYSKTPEIKGTWQKNNLTTSLNAFDNVKAIHFKNYNYAISNNSEIWRVKDENPDKMKKVLELSEILYGDSLSIFNNELYISTQQGMIWKTADGISWSQIHTHGLPAAVSRIITSSDKMYATLDSAEYTGTYYSKDGENWNLLTKKYYAETVYQNTLYLSKIGAEKNSGLYRLVNNKHFKKISSLAGCYFYGSAQGIFAVKNVSTPNEVSYKVYKSTNNSKFKKITHGNAMIADIIETGNEILLMVYTNEGYKTYLKKI